MGTLRGCGSIQLGTDRQGGSHRLALPSGPGPGFDRHPGLRIPGAERLQRALWIHLQHPMLLFNREDDCLAAKLRPENVPIADGRDEMLLPEIERQ